MENVERIFTLIINVAADTSMYICEKQKHFNLVLRSNFFPHTFRISINPHVFS